MTTYLPKEVQQGLDEARKRNKRKKSRLKVEFDGDMIPVLKLWENGFSVEIDRAPHLRGLVDLYEGSRIVSQCLVVASTEENGEIHFEFKRNTAATDRAALDFARRENAPVALIGRDERKN